VAVVGIACFPTNQTVIKTVTSSLFAMYVEREGNMIGFFVRAADQKRRVSIIDTPSISWRDSNEESDERVVATTTGRTCT
jgi:hypothetical protein